MQLRGARRRRGVDRGFVMSDHADWPGLHRAIGSTGAGQVFVTHGNIAVMVRYLREQGLDAQAFATEYGGEEEADPVHTEAGLPPDMREFKPCCRCNTFHRHGQGRGWGTGSRRFRL